MAALFRCQTIEQAMIRSWMGAQGVTAGMLAAVEPLGREKLRITWSTGERSVMHYEKGSVWTSEE